MEPVIVAAVIQAATELTKVTIQNGGNVDEEFARHYAAILKIVRSSYAQEGESPTSDTAKGDALLVAVL